MENDLTQTALLRYLNLNDTKLPAKTPDQHFLIDLFCGAGCAAEGYIKAGFTVIGIDLKNPSSYPGIFLQGDWLHWLEILLPIASAIHASPPCQEYSRLKAFTKIENSVKILPVRQALARSGLPYIIENVTSAPLLNPITLSGTQFGLKCIKKRAFESNKLLMMPGKAQERGQGYEVIAGNCFAASRASKLYGISRKLTRHELAEGIPPQYTNWLGWQLMQHITA